MLPIPKLYAYCIVWSLLITSCGSAPTTSNSVPAATPAPTAAIVGQQAWQETRKALPADVAVYAPTFIPARFSAPSVEEARVDATYGAVYTVFYRGTDENMVFIRNMGKGALGNSPEPESETPVTVNGIKANLWVSKETHNLGITWGQPGASYQVNAHSERMTPDELLQIVKSLTPVTAAAQGAAS